MRESKNGKYIILIVLMLALIAGLTTFLLTRDKSDPDDEEVEVTDGFDLDKEIESLSIEENGNDFDDPTYDNEMEDAVVTEQAAKEDAFYGDWVANSNRAHYLYGNINFSIKSDKTWTGNVTEEDYSGTWSYNGTGITLSSDFINCDLYFAQDGQLMFRDHDYPEDLIVLSKD